MIKPLPKRLYLDANILIYLIEGHPDFYGPTLTLFSQAKESGNRLIVSDLCQCECLMGAVRQQDQDLIYAYEAFFSESSHLFESAHISTDALDITPDLAANFNLKLMDALHLSLALQHGCDGFATNDQGFTGIEAVIDLVNLQEI